MDNPSLFISYSWDDDDHKAWVRDLAARLRADGVDAKLDRWETAPGDQLPAFMERAIRENTFVLIICTPSYKRKSDKREGGVGYEGDIMTAELYATGDQKKFIPALRSGEDEDAIPSWLSGKYRIDLRGEPYSDEQYEDLLTTVLGRRDKAPPVAPLNETSEPDRRAEAPSDGFENIQIEGIIVDEVSEPRRDGTRGSALYRIPFQLSRTPPSEWAQHFVNTWNHPPRFTTMHRPGNLSVVGDRLILDGTTIDEVERYHRDTLVLVVEKVNEEIAKRDALRRKQEEHRREQREQHRARVKEGAKRITF